MRTISRSFLMACWFGAALACGPATPVRAQALDRWTPWLIETLIARSDSIVVGRVGHPTTLPYGERLARATIARALKGTDRGAVTILGAAPSLFAFPKLEKILFLRRSPNGSLRVLVDFVDLAQSEREARLDFVERMVRIEALPPSSWPLEMRRLCLSHLASKSPWVRRIVAREAWHLARHRPGLFDARDLLRLRRFDGTDLPDDDAARYREALSRIEAANAIGWTSDRLQFRDQETKRLFLQQLSKFQTSKDPASRVRFLEEAATTFGRAVAPLLVKSLADGSEDGIVRRAAARILGELEAGAGVGALLDVVRRPRGDAALVKSCIEALGRIGDPRAVPALGRLLADRSLVESALTALASINTGEAATLINDFATRLPQGEETQRLRRHVRYLRSAEFRKELDRERRERRKRYDQKLR